MKFLIGINNTLKLLTSTLICTMYMRNRGVRHYSELKDPCLLLMSTRAEPRVP